MSELFVSLLDLLYKIVSGRNPVANTELALSTDPWDTYFNIPVADSNDYPPTGRPSRVHFVVDFVILHPFTETIHEAKLFLKPKNGERAIELFPLGDSALMHSGSEELGAAIERFVNTHDEFTTQRLAGSESARISVAAYRDLSTDDIFKNQSSKLLLALRLGTKRIAVVVDAFLSGTSSASVYERILWRREMSVETAGQIFKEISDDSSVFGPVAISKARCNLPVIQALGGGCGPRVFGNF